MLDFLIHTSYLVGGVAFLTALIALYLFPRLSLSLQIITVFVVVASCSEMLGIAYSTRGMSNIFIYHFYTFLEFFFLTIFFYQEYRRCHKKMPLILILTIGSVLIICNTIFIQPLDTFNSYSATLVSVAVLGYCIYYFMLTIDISEESKLPKIIKWIVISIFLFHCVSIVVLLFSNMIMEMEDKFHMIIWATRSVVILIIKLIILFQFVKLLNHKRLIHDGQ